MIDILGKKLLLIDDQILRFDQSAGSRAGYNYIKLLLDIGLEVSFIAADFVDDKHYSKHLRNLGVKVLTGACLHNFWRLWLPFYSRKFDYILFNRPKPSELFIGCVTRFSKAKTIYQCHDLHFLRLRRQYIIDEEPKTFVLSYESERLEMELIRKTDMFLTFSPYEKEIILNRLPKHNSEVVPLYFYKKLSPAVSDFSQRQGLLCVGSFKHNPNVDGVLWFINEVFPGIRHKCPGVTLYVAGGHPPEEISTLASEHVNILGYVTDEELSGLYQKVRLAIVPLRFGAGVKGKTMEAISFALPIVSTTIGIEGVGLDAIVPPTDHPHEFCSRVIELYNNEANLRECSTQLHQYALKNLMYTAAKDKMVQLLSSLADKEN